MIGIINMATGRKVKVQNRRLYILIVSALIAILACPLSGCGKKKGPADAAAVAKAMEYAQKGQGNEAIAEFTRAIQLNPENAKSYNNRGQIYSAMSNAELAMADFNKAIEVDPQLIMAYYNRGIIKEANGNINEALDDYSMAIQLGPENAHVIYNARGLAYAKKGNFIQCIQDCTKALDLNPGYLEAYNNRGLEYAAKGDLDEAISDFGKIIMYNPNIPLAYYNRAVAYYKIRIMTRAGRMFISARSWD